MKAKKNRGQLTPAQMKKGRKMAADWKWFSPDDFDNQLKLVEWDDPDYPEGVLIECGNLCRIHFRAPTQQELEEVHPRRRRDTSQRLDSLLRLPLVLHGHGLSPRNVSMCMSGMW